MPDYLWIIMALIIGLAAAAGLMTYRLARNQSKVAQALKEARQRISVMEEEHGQREIQRHATEEKLRSYLQLLDALLNTISNPIYFKDVDGVFQGCNKVFAKVILGLTRDRIIGKRQQDLPQQIPPDLAATYQRQEILMMEKGSFHTFEAPVQCADGPCRDFLFNLAPIQDNSGTAVGSVAVLSDLTDKNRAAEDRLQKEKLEGVLETAGGICHEFNQPLQALSGYIELLGVKLASGNPDVIIYLQKAMQQIERMRAITAKLQGITRYETMAYAGNNKIIDIARSSQ